MLRGSWADTEVCTDPAFPILEVFHQHDRAHGDVCRASPSTTKDWQCPIGCMGTEPKSRAPYCVRARVAGEPSLTAAAPCRVEVPVECVAERHCKLKTLE